MSLYSRIYILRLFKTKNAHKIEISSKSTYEALLMSKRYHSYANKMEETV